MKRRYSQLSLSLDEDENENDIVKNTTSNEGEEEDLLCDEIRVSCKVLGNKENERTNVTIYKLPYDSWIIHFNLPIDKQPTLKELELLWKMKPDNKGTIRMFNKDITVPRYEQTYGEKDYKFSGKVHEPKKIPDLIQRYIDYANDICSLYLSKLKNGDYEEEEEEEIKFNMCFTNWYPDGQHYIGFHADDEKQIYTSKDDRTLIFSLSFGQERKFILRLKDKKKRKRYNKDSKYFYLDIKDNDVVIMGGKTQKYYQHAVPKITSKKMKIDKRLNMTFRVFK